MISKAELQAEIASLENQSVSWQNCERLAALYAIRNEMSKGAEQAEKPDTLPTVKPVEQAENLITYTSGTDFSQAIRGMDASKAWAVMDELMETLRVINPRLYDGVLAELQR